MVMQFGIWDKVFTQFERSGLLIKYPGFEWVKALEPDTGNFLIGLQQWLSWMMVFGIATKLSTRIACLSFFWTFHQCERNHNNHYILMIHIMAIASFTDWGKMYSVDSMLSFLLKKIRRRDSLSAKKTEEKSPDRYTRSEISSVPRWQVQVMQLIFLVPYFFGGIAKLQEDWIVHQEPVRQWFKGFWRRREMRPLLAQVTHTFLAPYFIAWGGCVFDLTEPILLGLTPFFPKLLPISFGGSIFFNMTNKWMLSIGVFPYAMIASLVLFLPPGTVARALSMVREAATNVRMKVPAIKTPDSTTQKKLRNKTTQYTIGALFIAWCVCQTLYPIRARLLYPPYVSWHEEGHLAAWNMKLRSKACWAVFEVATVDSEKRPIIVSFNPDEDAVQIKSKEVKLISCHPFPALQYARYLARLHEMASRPIFNITIQSCVSVNERPPQKMFMENVNVLPFIDTYWRLGETGIGKFLYQLEPLESAKQDQSVMCQDPYEPNGVEIFIPEDYGVLNNSLSEAIRLSQLKNGAIRHLHETTEISFFDLYKAAGVVFDRRRKVFVEPRRGNQMLPLYYFMDNYDKLRSTL